jgi:serine/threonine-protein kinase RsbW
MPKSVPAQILIRVEAATVDPADLIRRKNNPHRCPTQLLAVLESGRHGRSGRRNSKKSGSTSIELERSLPSAVNAISPFVDKLMILINKCRCVPEGESDVEIALREALANAIIHGNREDARKQVHVSCRCASAGVSIIVRDEGQGFDINKVPDPTAPENIGSVHGRGIYLMKTLMDEVRFEEGGAVVHMRKTAT